MKICKNCKTPNENSSNFCKNCGCSDFELQQSSQDYLKSSQYDNMLPNEATNVLKSFVTEKSFFSLAILFTITVVFALINGVVSSSNISIINSYAETLNMDVSYMKYYFLFSAILSAIPGVLICIGLWSFRQACNNKNDDYINTKSLSQIKISLIIKFAISFISYIGFIVIFNNSINSSLEQSFEGIISSSSIISTLILIFVLISVLQGFYFFKLVKTITCIKYTAETGMPCDNISMFVIVMNYISAFGSVLNLFGGSFITFILYGCYCALYIVLSVMLYKYRNEMRILENIQDNDSYNA